MGLRRVVRSSEEAPAEASPLALPEPRMRVLPAHPEGCGYLLPGGSLLAGLADRSAQGLVGVELAAAQLGKSLEHRYLAHRMWNIRGTVPCS